MFDMNDPKMPDWERQMLAEQGFKAVLLPLLKRKKADGNEYHVYSNKEEFKAIEADTAVIAMEKSEIAVPYKIVPAYKRIEDVVQNEALEYVEKQAEPATNSVEVPAAPAPEGEGGAAETPPPAVGDEQGQSQ